MENKFCLINITGFSLSIRVMQAKAYSTKIGRNLFSTVLRVALDVDSNKGYFNRQSS